MLATNVIQAPPAVAIQVIKICMIARQAVIMHSPPGHGKTQIVEDLADSMQIQCVSYIASTVNPTDTAGIAYVDQKTGDIKRTWPDLIPRDGAGILHLDEFNRAPNLVQNSLLTLINNGKIGSVSLPPGWFIVASVNDSDAGVTAMSGAMNDRFCHVYLMNDVDNVVAYGQSKGWHEFVLAYLKKRPENLNSADKNSHANSSPRSWEKVSNILKSCPDISQDLAVVVFCGLLGKGIGLEFWSSVELLRKWPTPQQILADPSGSLCPDASDGSAPYMIGMAISRALSAGNADRFSVYLNRLPSEYHVLAFQQAVERDPGLKDTPEFSAFKNKFQVAYR